MFVMFVCLSYELLPLRGILDGVNAIFPTINGRKYDIDPIQISIILSRNHEITYIIYICYMFVVYQ